ncbi:MAG: 5-(carboxyamino)imidazole ribonucleotide synthase [Verrucomicrobiales bacterium]
MTQCIGILGGGQLGRMLALEARRMGYRSLMWIGGPNSGPADAADYIIEDNFDSEAGLAEFLEKADVATVEFENIPRSLLEKVAAKIPLYPNADAVATCQHREREKQFLHENGIPCAWFAVVDSAESFAEALKNLPNDGGILKTAEFGYDGKGQRRVSKSDDAAAVWAEFDTPRAVLEELVDLKSELSVLVVRDQNGAMATYDPAENFHRNHILDISIVPARLPDSITEQTKEIALRLTAALEYVGILAVEFFESTNGDIIVNEIAPRPHNSGHHTLDLCETSQFEQQLRTICGLPIGGTRTISEGVILNLLGDIWPEGGEPDWTSILKTPGAKLHLYGKHAARDGRKMGHVTFVAKTRAEALVQAEAAKVVLGIGS